MLSSLLRPRKSRRTRAIFPPSSPYGEPSSQANRGEDTARRESPEIRHAAADWTETENDNEDSEDDYEGQEGEEDHDEGNEETNDDDEQHNRNEDDEDGDDATPLLPIFSAAHLGTFFTFRYISNDISC